MALGNTWTTIGSGSFTSGGAVLTYHIEAKLNSQSIANNTSSISTRARTVVSGSMSSYNVHMSCTGCAPYDGNNSTIYYFGTRTVLEGVVTVNHNSDGTGTLSMSGACTGNLGMNIHLSGSVALPTIPRASKPTTSEPLVTIASPNFLTFYTNRASSSFTHTLTVTVGDESETFTNVGESVNFFPTVSKWMPAMDTWQKTATLTCTTYNGSTQIGSPQSTTFTIQVDTSVYKPVITVGTLTDTNAETTALTDNTFIQNKSTLTTQISVASNDTTYGDIVASSTATIGSTSDTHSGSTASMQYSFSAATTTNELVVTATDQRGYTVTQRVNFTLLGYSDISVSSVEYARVNANNAETETGEYIRYTIKANAFLGSFGRATNSIAVASKSKLASAQTYGAEVAEKTVTTSGSGMGEITITGVSQGTYSPSSQFDVVYILTDALSSVTSIAIRVHEGVPVAAWGADHFDVYGEFHVHDRDDVTQYTTIYPTGYRWQLAGTANGTNAVNFDSTICSEIMLVAKYVESSSNTWVATATIPTDALDQNGFFLMMPARIYSSSQYDKGCLIEITDYFARINEFFNNRSSVASNASLAVYYR